MKLEIGMYTVIIMVGPSQSGKSTWVKQFNKKIMDIDPDFRTTILSSDDIRRDLLGHNYHRYDTKMMEASEAAFDLLFAKLKAAIRFPINNEFVIVDTTGLDPDFRRKVSDEAKENGYRVAVVAFDYSTSDYFQGISADEKSIVAKHVDTFKKRTLPGMKRKYYDYYFTVKGKDKKYFEDLEIDMVDYLIWRKSNLTTVNFDNSCPLAIIGDVHEHVEALDLLIKKLPENVQLIFVGDLVDKGNQTKEIIEYIEKLKNPIFIEGNHESFVARRLRGQIDKIDKEDELFPSYRVLKDDKVLAEKFFKIYDAMLPYACIKTHGKTIYVTHAPCYNKSLGKLDERNKKFQRNFYFSSRENDSMMNELSFIEEQAKNSHPIHIFGHVAHSMKEVQFKNKVWLDTGVVYGGKLSAFVVYPNGNSKIVSQSAEKLTEGKLLYFTKNKMKVQETIVENKLIQNEVNKNELINNNLENNNIVDILANKYNLTSEDKYWLHNFNESDAKFISGTISPSRSTKEILEPIITALQYFHGNGIEKVIIQPKYMGSRLQLYLHRDASKDFATTRSGNKSSHQFQEIFDIWHKFLDSKDFWKDCIILDGELLPWSAIGKELIEKEFLQYGKSIEKELNLLENDIIFKNFNKINVDAHIKEINIFMKQLDLYGKDSPVKYNPFSILSVDGKSYVNENQLTIFKDLLPEEPYLLLNLENSESNKMAEDFFNNLTLEKGYEGVVIKPLYYKTSVAPFMKVRNEDYLHLIYGYDYKFNYQKMVENKKINRKLELSIKEFELGQAMLESKSKKELLELACQMKFHINLENDLDSRL